jgi:phospholipase C
MSRTRTVGFGVVLAVVVIGAAILTRPSSAPQPTPPADSRSTITPVEHLVVIFQENVSFDHYFATYPKAENLPGETVFTASANTPAVDGLDASLLAPNNSNAAQPFRLGPAQAQTCSQDHGYAAEQAAFNGGRMDRFVEEVGNGAGGCPDYGHGVGLTMGYFDGNTVTALWSYAQHFAMSDTSFGTTFGPSTVGAINLISGQTTGFAPAAGVTAAGTLVGDPEPAGDACASGESTSAREGRNIGDLLTAKGVTWGWFQGGFADCASSHANLGGVVSRDYVPHHDPFQYYASTANPSHEPPASVAEIGHAGPANHNYDLASFWDAVDAGTMPAVSFIKAPAYADGHSGYSSPLDEQRFLVDTLNRLQAYPEWAGTAVVIAYDDSDGWYDHVYGPQVHDDADRKGLGPRLPLLVVSPFAKANYVDHTVTDQTSILRFIEDNWMTGRIGGTSYDEHAGSIQSMFDFEARARPVLLLDPATGSPVEK